MSLWNILRVPIFLLLVQYALPSILPEFLENTVDENRHNLTYVGEMLKEIVWKFNDLKLNGQVWRGSMNELVNDMDFLFKAFAQSVFLDQEIEAIAVSWLRMLLAYMRSRNSPPLNNMKLRQELTFPKDYGRSDFIIDPRNFLQKPEAQSYYSAFVIEAKFRGRHLTKDFEDEICSYFLGWKYLGNTVRKRPIMRGVLTNLNTHMWFKCNSMDLDKEICKCVTFIDQKSLVDTNYEPLYSNIHLFMERMTLMMTDEAPL